MKAAIFVLTLTAVLFGQTAKAEPKQYADPGTVALLGGMTAGSMVVGCAGATMMLGVKSSDRFKSSCAEGAALGAAAATAGFTIGLTAGESFDAVDEHTLNAAGADENASSEQER